MAGPLFRRLNIRMNTTAPTALSANVGRLVSSMDVRHDAAALRERADRDGYLYMPGLLDPARLLELRRQFVTLLSDLGWLDPGADPMDAIARPGQEPIWESHEAFGPAFLGFQKLELFHALPHDPAILDVLERLFGETVLVHPRHIGRIMFPQTPVTPPHQDYLHIRGTETTYTAWIPLGDAPIELGGLKVLPGMHKQGLLPVRQMPGAGGAGIEDHNLANNWLTVDYRAGDVLFIHSMTPHASMPNHTGNRMRLSLDYRYQPVSHPVNPSSLQPHRPGVQKLTWEEIYAGWKSDQFKYYWQKLPLNVVKPQPGEAKAGY